MNIFYLHNDPKTCAQYHADKHVVKMIVEYAQLMSTAHRVLDGRTDDKIYKSTHPNHPSAIWVRQSKENYVWLFRLWAHLMDEYTYRYGKIHACERLLYELSSSPVNISQGPFTEPTPAMPDEYKVANNSIQSYINYYNGAKVKLFNWKKRTVPYFIQEYQHANV